MSLLYHKINSIFKRDPATNKFTNEFAQPEFGYLQSNMWEWTEKVDGTNIRVTWDGTNITYGGRTDNAQLPSKLVQHLRDTFTPEKFASLPPLVLYGEGYGAGIQKGGCYGKDQRFVLFDININNWWLKREDVQDIASQLNTAVVPLVGRGDLYEAIRFVQSEPQSTWGPFVSEGLVIRPTVELFDRGGNRIITKVKVRDFK